MRLKKIIFVDDDPRVLEAFMRMTRKKADEWSCRFAKSADEAWEMILGDEPDAIVSDLNMPGKSGADLLELVRNTPQTARLPFMLLTGNNEAKMRMHCLEQGATDFLNKPCDFSELVARMNNALTLKEFQDEVRSQNEILEVRVKERTLELESSRREVVFRLARAAELRDSATGFHILRVGLLSKLLAMELGFGEKFQEELLLASTLHDIGKLGIPDSILLKPAKLSNEEFQTMQSHCKIGADLLRSDLYSTFRLLSSEVNDANDLLTLAADIALSHHEKWDGTGYPNGLAGDVIPMTGRIVAVADVYDAVCSKRPYKEAFSFEDAIKVIHQGSGTHFDPKVASALIRRQKDAQDIMSEYSDDELVEKTTAA
jgi:response regulator RpfG family c-di-GMP phosphodiesterase